MFYYSVPNFANMQFIKYHALGNDYLVLQGKNLHDIEPGLDLSPESIRWICDRHRGVGADGILVPTQSLNGKFATGVRIYNPDGSEAEKSENGLRIFARWLFDRGEVGADPFEIETVGGRVLCQVLDQGRWVQVDMGQVQFGAIELFSAEGLIGHIANIGNPHCVIFCEAISAEETIRIGPRIENDLRFPKRTNVQFVRVVDRNNLHIEIWERGAGYTLASGSSSCAACAVAVRLGLCDGDVHVHMPGGTLDVTVSPDFYLRQTGPVKRIAHIDWLPESDRE